MGEFDDPLWLVAEEAFFDLDQLARALAVDAGWVRLRVEEGALAPASLQAQWRFSGRDLLRARRMRRLESDFDAVPELAALVADLLEDMDAMRARLARLGG